MGVTVTVKKCHMIMMEMTAWTACVSDIFLCTRKN